MPPSPDWTLGCIFSEKPRNLSNCSVWALEWPPPAGVQLVWGPRPGGALKQCRHGADGEKSPPALSEHQPAICRLRSELAHCLISQGTDNYIFIRWNKKPGLTQVRLGFIGSCFTFSSYKNVSEPRKMSTAPCIPRRSPIQVLTWLNVA